MTGSHSGSTSTGSAPIGTTPAVSAATTNLHWTLQSPIKMSKVTPYYGKLGIKLSTDNYIPWSRVVEATLSPIDLFDYCLGKIPTPSDPGELLYWK
jgi:hypothetical protein